MLEVTITHQIDDANEDMLRRSEALELWEMRAIGLGTEGFGPDWQKYIERGHKEQAALFREVAEQGAAVVASFPRLDSKWNSLRVVGEIRPQEVGRFGRGLMYLRFHRPKVFDATVSFLGNLAPRSCTIQRCWNRSRGALSRLARGEPIPRAYQSLHCKDLEWLTLNYLSIQKKCQTVWSGGCAFPAIDGVGWSESGRCTLSQTSATTNSTEIRKKCSALLERRGEADLVLFAPLEMKSAVSDGVEFVALEEVFQTMDGTPGGRMMIDRAVDVKPVPIS